MADFIATTVTGLEAVAAQELEEVFGIGATGKLAGAVLFGGPEAPSPEAIGVLRRLNAWSRGFDRFGVLLAASTAVDLDACYEAAREVDVAALIGRGQSFAVRPLRSGSHAFGSPDIGRVVGQAVVDAYEASAGARPPVSLRHPDVILRAEIIDDRFRFWLDGTGDEPLYRRSYRRQLHPASLRPSLVHLMLRLADWRGGPLLDPMTGIGTIPIEAALYGRGIAPGHFRSAPCACEQLVWSDAGTREAGRPAPPVRIGEPTIGEPLCGGLDILGVERYDRHVQGAWLNLAAAGALDGVRIVSGDAARLEDVVERGRYPVAVMNPPFGRRIGSTSIVGELYAGFAASAAERGVARIVSSAENRGLMIGALEAAGYRVVEAFRVLYGELPAHVIVADR